MNFGAILSFLYARFKKDQLNEIKDIYITDALRIIAIDGITWVKDKERYYDLLQRIKEPQKQTDLRTEAEIIAETHGALKDYFAKKKGA